MSETNEKQVKEPTINTERKTRLCIVILVLALAISFAVLLMECIDFNLRRSKSEIEEKMTHYWSFTKAREVLTLAFEGFDDINNATTAELTASMLEKSSAREQEDVHMYEDGCVFRYNGKKCEFPRGLPKDMDVESVKPDRDTGDLRTQGSEDGSDKYKPYDVYYSKVRDDLRNRGQ